MRALLHLDVKLPTYIPIPQNDWVLLQNISPKEIKTAGGIWVPQDEVREDLGLVIAVGSGLPVGNGGRIPFALKPGDVVRTTRKKGRTAYLDCMGPDGVGDTQTAYSYYQWNEVIAVEYHSEYLAAEILRVSEENSSVVTLEEEVAYREEIARQKKEDAKNLEEKNKKQDENIKNSSALREKLMERVFDKGE